MSWSPPTCFPLYVDTVGGGAPYLEALRRRLPALLEGLDLAAVPVEPRLGAWSALHGTWQDLALVQDLLADNPHGLPHGSGLVQLPDGLSTAVPDSWRALTDADRRPRSFVDRRLEVVDGRVRVRGACFVEYVEGSPLPRVALHTPDGQVHDLEVVRRPDRRTNEWAARAWEDRTDAGWEASGDADRVLVGAPSQATVQVLVGDRCFSEEVRVARPRRPGTELDTVSFADGVLAVAGSTRERKDLRGHLSGPRGSGGDVTLRTSGERLEGEVPLTTTSFGAPARLPVGRYGLGLTSTSWAAALLREPAELVDARQRVELAQEADGAAVVVQPPLRADERGAYAQQRLRSGVYAAPAGVRRDTVLLETFRGRSVGDNPGAIGRELLSRGPRASTWSGSSTTRASRSPTAPVPSPAARPSGTTLLGHARGLRRQRGGAVLVREAAGPVAPADLARHPAEADRGGPRARRLRRPGGTAGGSRAQAAGWDAMVSPSPYCSDDLPPARSASTDRCSRPATPATTSCSPPGAPTRAARCGPGSALTDEDRVVLYAPTWREYLGVRAPASRCTSTRSG